MNLSMKLALDDSKNENLSVDDLGFILTVLRDNTSDDFVHEVLNNVLNCSKKLW